MNRAKAESKPTPIKMSFVSLVIYNFIPYNLANYKYVT
jgi:hypothetical protein